MNSRRDHTQISKDPMLTIESGTQMTHQLEGTFKMGSPCGCGGRGFGDCPTGFPFTLGFTRKVAPLDKLSPAVTSRWSHHCTVVSW